MRALFKFIFLSLSINAFAQHKLYIEGAIGTSQVRFIDNTNDAHYPSGYKFKNYFRTSYLGGIGYKYQFKKTLGVGFTPSASQFNGRLVVKFDQSYPSGNGITTYSYTQTTDIKLTYYHFPLYISLRDKKLSLDLGYQTSVTHYRKYEFTSTETFVFYSRTTSHSEYGDATGYATIDHGPFASVKYSASNVVDLFVRYYQGMYDISENYAEKNALKNVQILAGLRFNFFVSRQYQKGSAAQAN